jgi:hypothetical protein
MDAKNVIDRIKNLKEFEVIIDIPPEVMFDGSPIPFNLRVIRVDKNQVASVRLLAESQQEAEEKVKNFFVSKGYYE